MALYTKKILSLFSGIGGFDLGIKLAIPNSRTVCYVEREAYPCSVLVSRFKDGSLDEAPIWSDVTTFPGKDWSHKVDIIIAGFPCQPWSSAGKRKKTKDERWLWPAIAKTICEVAPFQVFLENVPELCNGGIQIVLGSLAALGYDAEWGVFSAQQVGSPHRRNRVFILAQLADTKGNGTRRKFGNNSKKISKRKSFPSIKYFCQGMANTPFRRPCQPEKIKKLGRNRFSINRSRVLLFPPGQEDIEGWKRIIRRNDSVKPTVCRGSNGTSLPVGDTTEAIRKEEIRALGNGVVPLTAAFAYSVLFDRLNFCDIM